MLIITRHAGAVKWLRREKVEGEVVTHATPEQVQGQDVVGTLPIHLAALARSVTMIDLPDLKPEDRGRDLSPAEMDAAGAALRKYVVLTGEEADELSADINHGGGCVLPPWARRA